MTDEAFGPIHLYPYCMHTLAGFASQLAERTLTKSKDDSLMIVVVWLQIIFFLGWCHTVALRRLPVPCCLHLLPVEVKLLLLLLLL